MKKYLKIDKAIYEVDDNARTYRFINRNFSWTKLSEEENQANMKHIQGYSRIMDNNSSVNNSVKNLSDELEKKPVKELIENLSSKNATLKYQSSKALISLSEKEPQKIYPYFDSFVRLFENENNILKWTGIIIIGELSKVDKEHKIKKILPQLYSLLNTGKMITAGNTCHTLGKIALNSPGFANKITNELLKVEKYKYDTDECGHIANGHVIEAFNSYLEKPDKKVMDFIRRQTKNPRSATAKKAEKYLKKINQLEEL